jgi:uncharacterized membrane protein YecN with MAPEG domain
MTMLPTTLSLAAAALLINFWLSMRCGRIRTTEKISIGDGGNDLLMRRMRAHANFGEQVPITLIAIAAIELAGKGGMWLGPLASLFMAGRIAHAIGMDGNFSAGRPIGMLTGMVLQLALVVVAVGTLLGKM